MKPEILNVLVLSTAHLKEDDGDKFNISNNIVHYELEDTGWLVWVGPVKTFQPDFSELSGGFLESYKLAQKLGCTYIKFDRDGPVTDNLPTYEW